MTERVVSYTFLGVIKVTKFYNTQYITFSTKKISGNKQSKVDKVLKSRLLAKLKAYNLSSEVVNWIKEHFTDRS